MAEKKTVSQAKKAVSDAKHKNSGSTSKKSTSAKTPPAPVYEENDVPRRLVAALVVFCLFVVFLLMAVNPEGALLNTVRPLLLGLFGKVSFSFAIPALLYMFVILVSSGKEPVRSRCVSLVVFTLLCGCFQHLLVNDMTFKETNHLITRLFQGGADGTSGGVVCGVAAIFVRWFFGNVLSFILFAIGAALSLLASMKITIPSIIRAIRNRPRDDWEEDDYEEERPEPAAIVVNHIANKRIEYNRQRRQRMEAEEEYDAYDAGDLVFIDESKPPKAEKKP